MRTVVVDRRRLGVDPLRLAEGYASDPASAVAVFDAHNIPDGFPFVVDDDGDVSGCRYLNQYLLDAWEQRAFDLGNMRKFHVYHLSRLLRFVRRSRAEQLARSAGVPANEWLEQHGEPKVDLVETSRDDLTAYRDSRLLSVEAETLDTEIGCLSSFFRYALKMTWVAADPMPHWGDRNTLRSGRQKVRQARFLSGQQAAHFLNVGLRGDGADERPACPERDYTYGLLLATTGLRREEGAFVLDNEIPTPAQMPPDGVHVFNRAGKLGVTRSVYVTAEAARAVDLYRQTERAALVRRYQRSLRARRRANELFIVDGVTTLRGAPAVVVDGHARPTVGLSDEERARAVRIRDDGSIEPLGLFIARGLPPVLEYWNHLFADARDRVHERGDADRPPEHITVSPHTLRHTFAVRMLAGLMAEGRERAGDPYMLLANPVQTVKELLGHADASTTQDYLFAAKIWHDEVPKTLRSLAGDLVGHRADDPVAGASESGQDYEDDE